MTIGSDLGHRLDSWMQEDASLPDDLPEVLARLPETPQRHHRRSFHFDDMTWRTRTMFTATRVAAGVAIIALASSLAFMADPLGSPQEPTVPISPAAIADEQSMAPASIRATYLWGLDGNNKGEEDGDFLRGRIGKMWAFDALDPRLDGTARFVHDARDDGGLGPQWGTFRLETDDGAWEGAMSGFWDQYETRTSGWLRGDGAYTGLAMYLETVIDHAGPAEMVGIIVPGDPPSDLPTFD